MLIIELQKDLYILNLTFRYFIKLIGKFQIGHVLGLCEFTHIESTNNVMHQWSLATTKLGPADIAAYRYLWN